MDPYHLGAERINPGPMNGELLTMQGKHRSDAIWHNSVERDVLRTRRGSLEGHYKHIDERIMPYIRSAGLLGIARIGVISVDWTLITSLIERWRPETHSFHLTCGEATITLEDVGILTGLPIEGRPVTGRTNYDWEDVCNNLLGVVPSAADMRGGQIKMTWLDRVFGDIPDDATPLILQQYARAWILRCFGGMLFSSQSSSTVHLMFLPMLEDLNSVGQYSWGSACLAWLYRELCRATRPNAKGVAGYMQLLQLWAWERLPMFRPEHVEAHPLNRDLPYGIRWSVVLDRNIMSRRDIWTYREILDTQGVEEFEWEPYHNVIQLLPDVCRSGQQSWMAVVSLICFYIIEWHHPDRVMRQFGFDQQIPSPPLIQDNLHTIDMRGQIQVNWAIEFAAFINEWNNRHGRVVVGQLRRRPLHFRSEYMQWYVQRTRRWITPVGARRGATADDLERVYHEHPGYVDNNRIFESILGAIGYEDRVSNEYQRQPCPQPVTVAPMEIQFQDFRTRRHRTGMIDRRKNVEQTYYDPQVTQIPPPMAWPYQDAGVAQHFEMGGTSYTPGDTAGPSSSYHGIPMSVLIEQTPHAFTLPAFNTQSTPTQDVYGNEFLQQLFGTPEQVNPQSSSEGPLFGNVHNDMMGGDVGPSNAEEGDVQQGEGQRRYPGRNRRPTRCGTGSHFIN